MVTLSLWLPVLSMTLIKGKDRKRVKLGGEGPRVTSGRPGMGRFDAGMSGASSGGSGGGGSGGSMRRGVEPLTVLAMMWTLDGIHPPESVLREALLHYAALDEPYRVIEVLRLIIDHHHHPPHHAHAHPHAQPQPHYTTQLPAERLAALLSEIENMRRLDIVLEALEEMSMS